jgi:uncharacterized SAM-binding protein YcdF (DUF218 family)
MRTRHRLWLWAVVLCVAGFVAAFVGIAVEVQRAATRDETRPAGAIIVFGAAEYAGRPSPVFRARLDHAYRLFRRGMAPLVIVTGGAANDPKYTEGGVGRDYLITRGIPDLNLVAETQSDDTAESAVRTATILRANGIRDCIAVSDAYHLFRVKRMMAAQGIVVYASPRAASIPRSWDARALAAGREALSYIFWKVQPVGKL